MSLEELTKKEKIINFARNDPFLKISDIAEHVQTTPRYVRTILSEANISLMKLREKYARKIEQKLQIKESTSQRVQVRLIDQKGEVSTGKVRVDNLAGESFKELEPDSSEQELYKLSQRRMVGQNSFGVQEIITYLATDFDEESIQDLDSLYELFGNAEESDELAGLRFRSNIMEVESANQLLAELLQIKKNKPIIKSQRLILDGEQPVAIENCFFDAKQVQLIVPGEFVI